MARTPTKTASPATQSPAPDQDLSWLNTIPEAKEVVYFQAGAYNAEQDTPEGVKKAARDAYDAYQAGNTKFRQIEFASAERAKVFTTVLKKYCAAHTPRWTVRGGPGQESRQEDPKVVTFQVKPFEARPRKES